MIPIGNSISTPNFRRLMSFIDGENLVFCYENILSSGKRPKTTTTHVEKTFVWNPNTIEPKQFEILKTTMYTYATGTEQKIDQIKNNIKQLEFSKDSQSTLPNNLTPVVFKKEKQNNKTKGVDIKMTVDILMHSYNHNLDTVFLVAGDGDYLPVIKEVLRRGKQVYLAFFSHGLNENLLNYVDKYICLDAIYFE